MALTWDETQFANAYSIPDREAGPGVRIGYGRRFAQIVATTPAGATFPFYRRRVNALVAAFPIQPADRILVAGCGFGYIIDEFKDAGFPNCWGIDSSSYISGRRSIEATDTTLFVSDTITGGGRVKAALRSLTGDDIFHWVISESLLEGQTDAEIPALLNAAEGVLDPSVTQDHIIHMVVPLQSDASQDAEFNWKTLADWNAMRPAHSWMALASGDDCVAWEVL